jgi:hypothetical protein
VNEPGVTPPTLRDSLFVDGHVHFHECFTWKVFLDAAAANLARARSATGRSRETRGCLLFTESAGASHFRALADRPALAGSAGWRAEKGDDGCSLLLTSPGRSPLALVAGRQIVAAERLEVLALGCAREIPDGRPIRDVLRAVADENALAVVPWGFGKWMGRRGRIVRDLVERAGETPLCLGDNGGRMRLLPRPAIFGWAERRGILVLGGSDPLPLPDHATRAGSYGFVLEEWRDSPAPAAAVKARLRELRRSPPAFGSLSSASAALRAQAGLRWQQARMKPAEQRVTV